MKRLINIAAGLLMFISTIANGQQNTISNNYKNENGLVHLNIERQIIYSPDKEWLYNHHAGIIEFKGKLLATWSSGMVDEDSPGQRVVFSVSEDFKHWSAAAPLATPSKAADGTFTILTAAGLYKYNDTLVAYYGEYKKDRTDTHLWAKTSTDGVHWSKPIDMHLPLIPNQGPVVTKSGRLIICGNFSFPYTDDHRGLSGWKMSSFYPNSLYQQDNSSAFYSPAEKTGLPPLCEGSFFQTDDNILHMLLRVTGKGWKGWLWLTESKDNGKTWSKPIQTNFTDNDSKFQFGRLADTRYFYVGIPDTLHHYDRNPLVLALSNDGKAFNKQYIISDELYQLKTKGLWKGGQYGYPHAITYNNEIYVIVSRQKESIEVIRFKLDGL